jgi:hypothetical protein
LRSDERQAFKRLGSSPFNRRYEGFMKKVKGKETGELDG